MPQPMTIQESFGFSISDYYIEHQKDAIIDIQVDYTHKANTEDDPDGYYEFQQIINHIDNYLKAYPNETDAWEVLNKNLTANLLTKKIQTQWKTNYKLSKHIKSMTVDIDVHAGTGGVPYARSTSVTGITKKKNPHIAKEAFGFEINDYYIEHQGTAILDINIDYIYKDGVGDEDPQNYYEFSQIANHINNFLVNFPNETDYWEILNKKLVKNLLTKDIATEWGDIYNLKKVIDQLTVEINVHSGAGGAPYFRTSTVKAKTHGKKRKSRSETRTPSLTNDDQPLQRAKASHDSPIKKDPKAVDGLTGTGADDLFRINPDSHISIENIEHQNDPMMINRISNLEAVSNFQLYQASSKRHLRKPLRSEADLIYVEDDGEFLFNNQELSREVVLAMLQGPPELLSENRCLV